MRILRESNIRLCSNIHILKSELENDKEFHAKVRGRKALNHLLGKVVKEKEQTEIALNNLQIAEINHAGIPLDNCKFKKAWGIVVDNEQNYFVECRCDYSECPQYNACLSKKIELNDIINDINELEILTDKLSNNYSEPISKIESLASIATEIEREVSDLSIGKDVVELVEVKHNKLIDEELLMNCLVSIERIAGDIVHLKDITERLDKDVSEIRNKIHKKLTQHKHSMR